MNDLWTKDISQHMGLICARENILYCNGELRVKISQVSISMNVIKYFVQNYYKKYVSDSVAMVQLFHLIVETLWVIAFGVHHLHQISSVTTSLCIMKPTDLYMYLIFILHHVDMRFKYINIFNGDEVMICRYSL